MQIMMVIVLIFSVYNLINFFSKSATQIVDTFNNDADCGTVSQMSDQNLSANGIDGKELFNANCAPCHKADKDLVGPALHGVMERWPDKKLLYSWIRNNEDVLKSGNKYANDLYKKWGSRMPLFTKLTDDEIKAILSYLGRRKPQQYSSQIVVSL